MTTTPALVRALQPERMGAAARRAESVEAAFHEAVTDPVAARAGSLRAAPANWKLGRKYDLTTLSPDELTLEEEARFLTDCNRCSDRCCTDPRGEVSLRLLDVWRFIDAGLDDAIETAPPRHAADHPELAETEARDSYRRFPTVKKAASGACSLLDADERCAAWEVRPLACRRFPHRLSDDRARVQWNQRCPSKGAPLDDAQAALALRRVADHDNVKKRDLVTLVHGQEILARSGLLRWLPTLP